MNQALFNLNIVYFVIRILNYAIYLMVEVTLVDRRCIIITGWLTLKGQYKYDYSSYLFKTCPVRSFHAFTCPVSCSWLLLVSNLKVYYHNLRVIPSLRAVLFLVSPPKYINVLLYMILSCILYRENEMKLKTDIRNSFGYLKPA